MYLKKLVGTTLLGFASISANAAINAGTAQFSSKLFTEGLGRLPDQGAWGGTVSFWASNSCNLANLQYIARNLLTSAEFLSTSPTAQEKVFRLYRAVLHRDANVNELTYGINLLNSGSVWAAAVDNTLNSSEFISRVSQNCSSTPYGWQPVAPANIVLTNTGAAKDEATLRARLASAKAGSTVFLEQGAVIRLSDNLVIPENVTVATVGTPGAGKAPLLARITRNFSNPTANVNLPETITLSSGSKLDSVWIDGQRNNLGYLNKTLIQARGDNASVQRSMLSDSTGFTHLHFYRDINEAPYCTGGSAVNNLITAYGAKHAEGLGFSDGISVSCTNVIVENNSIVDATDVGVVVFRSHPATQTTIVRNNNIFNAGNSAYGGLVVDPLATISSTTFASRYPQSTVLDFTGTRIMNNTVWSSPNAHIDIVLSNGSRPWFGAESYTGKGASFTNNSSGTQTVTTFSAISVSGMLSATVQSNTLNALAAKPNNPSCPQRGTVVAPMPYGNDSTSSIQPYLLVSSSDPIVTGCIRTHQN